ncbi:MAG: metalloregulator ArsR/SmtB family transcription factor [Thermomicrobiales bacterium]
MHALDVLGEPVRRRIIEILAQGDCTAGDLSAIVQAEFGISQPAVSQHLKVLRESTLVSAAQEGRHRRYRLERATLAEVDAWLAALRSSWDSPLDALATEIARGKRQRRLDADLSTQERDAG